MPVPVLILAYAWLLRDRNPVAARGFCLGAGLLLISIAFRSADGPLVRAYGLRHAFHLASHQRGDAGAYDPGARTGPAGRDGAMTGDLNLRWSPRMPDVL